MLDYLISNTPLLTVEEYGRLYVYGDPGNSLAGQVRFNLSNQKLETYTGYSWVCISWDLSVNLSQDVKDIIQWAKNKMQQDKELEDKMNKFPDLRDAYEKFRVLEASVYEEEKEPRE